MTKVRKVYSLKLPQGIKVLGQIIGAKSIWRSVFFEATNDSINICRSDSIGLRWFEWIIFIFMSYIPLRRYYFFIVILLKKESVPSPCLLHFILEAGEFLRQEMNYLRRRNKIMREVRSVCVWLAWTNYEFIQSFSTSVSMFHGNYLIWSFAFQLSFMSKVLTFKPGKVFKTLPKVMEILENKGNLKDEK